MKYYKIIVDNAIIGVISSNDFRRYFKRSGFIGPATEETGEVVSYNNVLYRDNWMRAVLDESVVYTPATIHEITEEEYTELHNLEDENFYFEPQPVNIPEQIINPNDAITIAYIRKLKLEALSNECQHAIEEGFDLDIRGETKHFSLTTYDQLNLMSLSTMAQTQSLIPYHADGEEVAFYTNDEINTIVQTATDLKIYHTTYYNALKEYINSLETVDEISAITYGVSIPDEYRSDVLKMLE